MSSEQAERKRLAKEQADNFFQQFNPLQELQPVALNLSDRFDRIDLDSSVPPKQLTAEEEKILTSRIKKNLTTTPLRQLSAKENQDRSESASTDRKADQANFMATFSQGEFQETKNMMSKYAREFAPHDQEWWQDSARKRKLKEVFHVQSDDSEDDYGNPQYVPSKDPKFVQALAQRQEKIEKYKQRRLKILKENEERKRRKQPLKAVPPEDAERYALSRNEKMEFTSLRQTLQEAFHRRAKEEEQAEGSNNPLNFAMCSHSISNDKRIEMGILALRQRNRHRQCRRLGLQVPASYERAHSIRVVPKFIQEELIQLDKAVEEDSSYEDDDAVLRKYTRDPLAYILGDDLRKKEQLEVGAIEAYRLQAARKKSGMVDHKQAFLKLRQSIHQEMKGVKNLPRVEQRVFWEQGLILKMAQYHEDQPGFFLEEVSNRKQFLNEIKTQYEELLKHPAMLRELIESFQVNNEAVPSSLASLLPSLEDIEAELAEKEADEESDHEMKPVAEASGRLEDSESISRHPQVQSAAQTQSPGQLFHQQEPTPSGLALENPSLRSTPAKALSSGQTIKQGHNSNNSSEVIGSAPPSDQSGLHEQTPLKTASKAQNQSSSLEQYNGTQSIRNEALEIMKKKLLKISRDDLMLYFDKTDFRKLHRKEQYYIESITDLEHAQIEELPSSAEDSDNTVTGEEVCLSHPVTLAYIQQLKQEKVPVKKTRNRKDLEILNINGQEQRWGRFKKKFLEDARRKNITSTSFIIDQDDPEKEKRLFWHDDRGFDSENSEDEQLRYRRTVKFAQREVSGFNEESQYLVQSRPMLNFEQFLLNELGGFEIFRDVFKKELPRKVNEIHQWLDTSLMDPFLSSHFKMDVLEGNTASFKEAYELERQEQRKAVDNSETKVFFNELKEILNVAYFCLEDLFKNAEKTKARRKRVPTWRLIVRGLPKSERHYSHFINLHFMKQAAGEAEKEPMEEEEMKESEADPIDTQKNNEPNQPAHQLEEVGHEPSFQEQDPVPQDSFEMQSDREDDPAEVEASTERDRGEAALEGSGPPDRESSLPTLKKSQDAKKETKETVQSPKIVEPRPIKFVLPESNIDDFKKELNAKAKRSVLAYDADDVQDAMRHALKTKAILENEEKLIREFKSQINPFLKKEGCPFKGYSFFRQADDPPLFDDSRIGTRKRRKMALQRGEDHGIFLGGIQVGYLLSTVPYMNTNVWKGQSIRLGNVPSSSYARQEHQSEIQKNKIEREEQRSRMVATARSRKEEKSNKAQKAKKPRGRKRKKGDLDKQKKL